MESDATEDRTKINVLSPIATRVMMQIVFIEKAINLSVSVDTSRGVDCRVIIDVSSVLLRGGMSSDKKRFLLA